MFIASHRVRMARFGLMSIKPGVLSLILAGTIQKPPFHQVSSSPNWQRRRERKVTSPTPARDPQTEHPWMSAHRRIQGSAHHSEQINGSFK